MQQNGGADSKGLAWLTRTTRGCRKLETWEIWMVVVVKRSQLWLKMCFSIIIHHFSKLNLLWFSGFSWSYDHSFLIILKLDLILRFTKLEVYTTRFSSSKKNPPGGLRDHPLRRARGAAAFWGQSAPNGYTMGNNWQRNQLVVQIGEGL